MIVYFIVWRYFLGRSVEKGKLIVFNDFVELRRYRLRVQRVIIYSVKYYREVSCIEMEL